VLHCGATTVNVKDDDGYFRWVEQDISSKLKRMQIVSCGVEPIILWSYELAYFIVCVLFVSFLSKNPFPPAPRYS
jgi:hypothetical protein